jgi:hypothetical protein
MVSFLQHPVGPASRAGKERAITEDKTMRKLLPGMLLGAALMLGACGGPTVNNAANQAASAIAEPTTSAAISDAANAAATELANPTTQAAINQAATALTGPQAASAAAEAASGLSAVAGDVTLQQGQAPVLDATKSAGNIADYKWTIEKAPSGAESVVGQVIKEGSSGNVSIDPADYAKYFPTAGNYTVRLTVTDAAGQASSTDFNIDVP